MCILGLKGLSLIAFFQPDVMYGMASFLNLIVLVGNYAFQQLVSNRVFQKWYLSSSVSEVSMVFHGSQARSSMNLSTPKALVLLLKSHSLDTFDVNPFTV